MISYDITDVNNNNRNYIRSMLERFHWQRLGGSVFRYEGTLINGRLYEDWLNHVAPSLMFLRSFLLLHNISLRFLTVDASSTAFLDHSDPGVPLGTSVQQGEDLDLAEPTNTQSSVIGIRDFVTASVRTIT